MSYDNVKLILKDSTGKYLVGRRLDSLIPYSAFGGKRESGENDFQTLNRELAEESCGILSFKIQNKKLYLNVQIGNKEYEYEINSFDKKQVNKQVYYVMKTPYDLSKNVSIWNQYFKQKQNEMIEYIYQSLRDTLDNRITNSKIYEWILRFRNNYDSPYLQMILQNLKFDGKEIKTIINFLQNNGYYLEMDGIELVDKNKIENGLYEKGFFLIQDQKFKDFFRN